MPQFKLLVGQHIQADPDWEPSEEERELAKNAGRALRPPSRVYRAGETVESDTDLVERFGPEKFQMVQDKYRLREGVAKGRKVQARKGVPEGVETRSPGDPTPEIERTSPSVAPAGQVAQGFQGATSPVNTTTPSGPLPVEAAQTEESEESEEADDKEESPPKAPPAPRGPRAKRSVPDNLDRMSLNDLRAFAAEEEVDIKGATRREDIIRQIRASKSGS
jgi:hypothetical protein